jgi:hypothetical protein
MKIEKYSEFNNQNISEEIDWANIKYKIGKLGSITKGGKFFGKGKQNDKAKAEIDAILGDAKNKFISDMDKKIKEAIPEFPNNKERDKFLDGLSIISATYDSIVQACLRTYGSPETGELKGLLKKDEQGNYTTVLKPEDKGYMPIDMANTLILSLQKYMQKIIDYDLSTSYTIFENAQLTQEEVSLLIEEISLNPLNWFKKKPETAALAGGTDTATKKMVNSSKYEKIIGALGVSLGVFGWVVQTEWFKTMMETWLNKPEITKDVVTTDIKNLNMQIKDGEGMTQALNRTFGTSFNRNTPVTEFINTLKEKGLGNSPTEIFNNLGMQSASPNPSFNSDAVSALSSGGNLQNAFSGIFSGKGGSLLALNPGKFLAKQITTQITKVVIQQAVKTGTTVAAGLAAAGPVLTGIGIAMVAGAITSWLLKRKAKKSSRYKDLQELLEKFQKLIVVEKMIKYSNGEEIVVIGGGEGGGTGNTGNTGEEEIPSEKSIYPLMIKNLKALNSMLITFDGVKAEGEGGGSGSKNQSLKIGNEYLYTNKKGEKKKVKLISLTHDTSIGGDKTWLTKDDTKGDTLGSGKVSVISRDKDNKYTSKSPEFAVDSNQLSPLKESLLLEKEFGKGSRNVEVTKGEDYLTQALGNIRKSIKSIKDEKDKGIGITTKFLGDVLDKKMDSNSKEPIKNLYKEIYSYLYGSKSKTLSDFGPLYKESIEILSNKSKSQVVAEKIARLAKRSLQFEGENLYGGLGEFGQDMEEFNITLKQIMAYEKSKSEVKEGKFLKFKDYIKS